MHYTNKEIVLPFLKWAGGKRWLVDDHIDVFNFEFDRFIEPFLGSGAVFFKLQPNEAILSDKNADLINAYEVIKSDWKKLTEYLKRHHAKHSNEYYYKVRATKPRTDIGKAARFIYLNRTCWNGLYRVNLNGQFNVPKGTKKNVLLESDNFEAIAKSLQNTKLKTSDFQSTMEEAKHGDFVFVDPPYTVKHNNNGFVKYNESIFTWEDQVRLRNCVAECAQRGVKVIVTNAYHSSIKELYKGVGDFLKLSRSSVISGKPDGRGTYEEILIKCY